MNRISIFLLSTLLLSSAAAGSAAATKKTQPRGAPTAEIAAAREALDGGQPERALARLAPYLEEHPRSAEGLLLRGTARLMMGETRDGRADLERALQLDPAQREGWLNLGALAIAEKRWDDALEAFLEAEKLAPEAPENDLNIGAVLLLSGKLAAASERFEAYLEGAGSGEGPGPEGYYLVASNYAMAGYAALAIEHLKRAVEGEERTRRRARVDPNFRDLWGHPQFQELLTTESYRPPPGAYTAARDFTVTYDTRDGQLLRAVLDTLQLSGVPFDPNVEVTPEWALIWGDVRIKVSGTPEGKGRVEISAPPAAMTPAEWRGQVDQLFRGIEERLILSGAVPPDGVPPDGVPPAVASPSP